MWAAVGMAFFIPGIRALWKSARGGARHGDEASESEAVVQPPKRTGRTYAREAGALLLMAAGLYCGLALASFAADPLRPEMRGENWVGPVGAVFAEVGVKMVGVVAWLVPLELTLLARPLLRDRRIRLGVTRLSGDIVIAVVLAALMHIAVPTMKAFGNMPFGGLVGELFGEVMRGLFSTVGSYLIGSTIVMLILIERAAFSFIATAQRLIQWFGALRQRSQRGVDALGRAWNEARDREKQRREEEREAAEPLIASPEQADAIIAAFADDGLPEPPLAEPVPASEPPPPVEKEAPKLQVELHEATTPSPPEVVARAPAKPRKKKEPDGPTIVDTTRAARTRKAEKATPAAAARFRLPPADLLEPAAHGRFELSAEALRETARLLEKTLADYRVDGKVQEIHPGPTVTMYEVSPAPGTKVSKVAGLADDLALGLSRKVRIVAPIPGKNRIGFEVPNERRVPVNLRELVESQDFMDLKRPLPCVLGRDIIGRPFFADLASMPHVIVAGATGAGKSVGLNVMLVSLLYRRTPDEMRILMIDPKVVELAPFDGIPHLLFPVVTDMKQAANALRWTVDEMERRYQLFADAGSRNIATYNRWVKRVLSGELPTPSGPDKVTAITPEGEAVSVPRARDGSDAQPPKRLPYIVVVVEEFADLMMTQGKEVEASV
ncbi:MAG TPA: DNA translocase FtsK 4TM domain-containing protein, partial [Polyangiaceae bacterium]|nr:DNA translocase FtsK 4TM domain-containing protein [Polyangiaceae bacterium]